MRHPQPRYQQMDKVVIDGILSEVMTIEMSVTFSTAEANNIWKLQSDMEKYFHNIIS